MSESDTLYIGRPISLAVDPRDGTYYVGDVLSGRVIRFDRAGRPIETYGHPGSGPGEFRSLGLVLPLDTILAISDDGSDRLELFQTRTGTYIDEVRYTGILRSATSDSASAQVVLGALDPARRVGVEVVDLASGAENYRAPMPASYVESSPLRGIYDGVAVDSWSDTLLVGFMGSDSVRFYSPFGSLARSVAIPAVRRRGVPADIVARMRRVRSFPKLFSMASYLFAVHHLTDGAIALIHYDQAYHRARISSRVFVSILAAGSDHACVDAPVTPTGDIQPLTAFRGDTLFVLTQQVDPRRQRAISEIRAYTLRTDHCNWISTGAVSTNPT